jgi:hypothetical protein
MKINTGGKATRALDTPRAGIRRCLRATSDLYSPTREESDYPSGDRAFLRCHDSRRDNTRFAPKFRFAKMAGRVFGSHRFHRLPSDHFLRIGGTVPGREVKNSFADIAASCLNNPPLSVGKSSVSNGVTL